MIMDRISACQYVMISVFSQFSQSTALLLIKEIKTRYPDKIILVGGVGSQKPTHVSTTKQFGEILLENKLIDSWQQDTSTSEIDRILPQRLLSRHINDVDFSIYKIDSYVWPRVFQWCVWI